MVSNKNSSKMSFQQKYDFAVEKLKDFKNFLEIGDFRKFLLLILNLEGSGPEGILSQLGLGGSKGKTILPYDPEKKIYYAKIMAGMSLGDQLLIYIKSGQETTELVNKADSKLFEKHLTPFERKNLLPSKFLLFSPRIIDYTKLAYTKESTPKPSTSAVESLFIDLTEFLITQNLKYVFFLEGKENEADLAFTINMSFDPTHSSPNSIQFFDVYVDEQKELRGKSFIKATERPNEKVDISFANEIKESDVSEMFNSNITIIVPIKSFKPPG